MKRGSGLAFPEFQNTVSSRNSDLPILSKTNKGKIVKAGPKEPVCRHASHSPHVFRAWVCSAAQNPHHRTITAQHPRSRGEGGTDATCASSAEIKRAGTSKVPPHINTFHKVLGIFHSPFISVISLYLCCVLRLNFSRPILLYFLPLQQERPGSYF